MDRREGTYVFYRFSAPRDGPWHEAWQLVRRELRDDPLHLGDSVALENVRVRAVTHLVPAGLRVADIGTGTGILAAELARLGLRVVAIDHSARMLEAAGAKLTAENVKGVELRQGEASALPLEDGAVDAAFAHMVLHYLPSPSDALREMARVVAPGGKVVIVDFVLHEHEWMRQELGVTWLGFAEQELRGWFDEARLAGFRYETRAGDSSARDLPATFIASAHKPA